MGTIDSCLLLIRNDDLEDNGFHAKVKLLLKIDDICCLCGFDSF